MSKPSNQSGARRMIGHAGVYAIGNILSQLTGFIMLPVYTRYLTPADYGIVGLMIFAISLIEGLLGARLGRAVPKYYFDDQYGNARATVVSTAMLLTGLMTTLLTVILVLVREPVSALLFGSSAYNLIVGLFAVQILTNAIENYALIYLRLQQRPWIYISVSLTKLIVKLSLNIWLVVFMEMGVMGIAVSAFTSSSLFAFALGMYTLRQVGLGFNRELAVKMLRFCWPLWIAGVAGLYIGSSNRYFIRVFSSLDDVGLFELAIKFGAIISFLLWNPFSQYWQVERFRYYQRGNAENVFQHVFYFISTIMVLAALGVALFSGLVINVMADKAFHGATLAVPYLAFSTVFGCLTQYSNFSFMIKEKTGWISRNNYLTAVIITAFYITLIPIAGYVGAAISLMCGMCIQFLIVHYAAKKVYDMKIKLNYLLFSILISVLVLVVDSLMIGQSRILLEIGFKTFIYLCGSTVILCPIFRNKELRYQLLSLLPESKIKRILM